MFKLNVLNSECVLSKENPIITIVGNLEGIFKFLKRIHGMFVVNDSVAHEGLRVYSTFSVDFIDYNFDNIPSYPIKYFEDIDVSDLEKVSNKYPGIQQLIITNDLEIIETFKDCVENLYFIYIQEEDTDISELNKMKFKIEKFENGFRYEYSGCKLEELYKRYPEHYLPPQMG